MRYLSIFIFSFCFYSLSAQNGSVLESTAPDLESELEQPTLADWGVESESSGFAVASVSGRSFPDEQYLPEKKTLNVKLRGKARQVSWQVFSVCGELVQQGQIEDSKEISIYDILPGSYLLKVQKAKKSEELILILK